MKIERNNIQLITRVEMKIGLPKEQVPIWEETALFEVPEMTFPQQQATFSPPPQ